MIGGIINFLLDCLFPRHCLVCRKEGEYWCSSCKKVPMPRDYQELAINAPVFFDKVFILADYDNFLISELIKKCKYYFVKELALIMAELLLALIKENNLQGILVPVPLHKRRRAWRGFNQAELITKELSRLSSLQFNNCLERVVYQKPQAKLKEEQRKINLEKAFVAKQGLSGTIILVDDVVTTGTTLNECARELKKAGAQKVIALALAKG